MNEPDANLPPMARIRDERVRAELSMWIMRLEEHAWRRGLGFGFAVFGVCEALAVALGHGSLFAAGSYLVVALCLRVILS